MALVFATLLALCFCSANGESALTIRAAGSLNVPEGRTVAVSVSYCSTLPCANFVVWPFLNGSQWGADVPLANATYDSQRSSPGSPAFANCSASMLIPLPILGVATLLVAILTEPYFSTPWTVGQPLPPPAQRLAVSNQIDLTVVVNEQLLQQTHFRNQRASRGVPKFVMFWEPWFTPHNMNWGMAEAIPLVGRYSSLDIVAGENSTIAHMNRMVVRQHCFWFAESGIDAIGIDWTNNLWNVAQWSDRGVYAQELINATVSTLELYAQLDADGYRVPQFVLLLGLDNGPNASIAALDGEVAYVTQTLLQNHGGTEKLFVRDIGPNAEANLPLLILFDGGDIHGRFAPLNASQYTLRYMSSQNQYSHLNEKGFYSWMDGTIAPPATPSPTNASLFEAVTITNAFFANGGWLAPSARATDNGATLLQEAWQAAVFRPTLLFLCQWNEYAGQPTPSPEYVDIYNATFGNDMEPTALTTCGEVDRPNNAYCGGWGFRYVNLIRGIRDILEHTAPLQGSVTSTSGRSTNDTAGDRKRIGEEMLLLTVQHPVPWIPVSTQVPLQINVTLFGMCPMLVSLNVTVTETTMHDDGSALVRPIAAFTIPIATPPTEPSYGAIVSKVIPAAEVASWGTGKRLLSLASNTASGSPCSAPVHISYDALFSEKTSPPVAQDRVAVLFVAD